MEAQVIEAWEPTALSSEHGRILSCLMEHPTWDASRISLALALDETWTRAVLGADLFQAVCVLQCVWDLDG